MLFFYTAFKFRLRRVTFCQLWQKATKKRSYSTEFLPGFRAFLPWEFLGFGSLRMAWHFHRKAGTACQPTHHTGNIFTAMRRRISCFYVTYPPLASASPSALLHERHSHGKSGSKLQLSDDGGCWAKPATRLVSFAVREKKPPVRREDGKEKKELNLRKSGDRRKVRFFIPFRMTTQAPLQKIKTIFLILFSSSSKDILRKIWYTNLVKRKISPY